MRCAFIVRPKVTTGCVVKVYDAEFGLRPSPNAGPAGPRSPTPVRAARPAQCRRLPGGAIQQPCWTSTAARRARSSRTLRLAAKINKTAYDRLLTQHYNSWKVRYDRRPGRARRPSRPPTRTHAASSRQAQTCWSLEDAGHQDRPALPRPSLGGFIAAHEADVETLAAASQTPTHELTGKLIEPLGRRPGHDPRGPTCSRRSPSGRRRPAPATRRR
jgi:hypothetical protein